LICWRGRLLVSPADQHWLWSILSTNDRYADSDLHLRASLVTGRRHMVASVFSGHRSVLAAFRPSDHFLCLFHLAVLLKELRLHRIHPFGYALRNFFRGNMLTHELRERYPYIRRFEMISESQKVRELIRKIKYLRADPRKGFWNPLVPPLTCLQPTSSSDAVAVDRQVNLAQIDLRRPSRPPSSRQGRNDRPAQIRQVQIWKRGSFSPRIQRFHQRSRKPRQCSRLFLK
jgi:hypothetical protein